MITLNIQDKKYNLPTKPSEITLEIGKKIDEIFSEYPKMDIEGKKWLLATLINSTYDTVDLIVDSQIELILDNHIIFNKDYNFSLNKYIKLKGKVYEIKDLEPMTVEEYAQKELDLINGDNDELFLSLIKPVKWYKNIILKLLMKNKKTLNEILWFQYKLIILNYIGWKLHTLNEYSISSYNANIPKDQQDDDYELSDVEKFGVYNILMEICNGSLSEYKVWMDEDVRVLFKYILYNNLKNINSSQKSK